MKRARRTPTATASRSGSGGGRLLLPTARGSAGIEGGAWIFTQRTVVALYTHGACPHPHSLSRVGATPEPKASRLGRARGVEPSLEIVALGRGCGKLLLECEEVGVVLVVARSSDLATSSSLPQLQTRSSQARSPRPAPQPQLAARSPTELPDNLPLASDLDDLFGIDSVGAAGSGGAAACAAKAAAAKSAASSSAARGATRTRSVDRLPPISGKGKVGFT